MADRPHFFAGRHFDRFAHKRGQNDWIERRLHGPDSRFLPVSGQNNLVVNGDPPTAAMLTREQLGNTGQPVVYLGENRGLSCFAALMPDEHDPPWPDTRYAQVLSVAMLIDSADAAMLAYARALALWHHNHRFCSRCGQLNLAEQAGHLLRCQNEDCGYQQFPRVDPAIIVLVENDEACLLGRQAIWDKGRYATIAGFVEPGESLEDAVIREVDEETGIVAHSPVYQSSQPWPFPSSLMLGFHASAGSRDIVLKDGELEHADWFTPEQIACGDVIRLAPSVSISRRLIDDWYERVTGERLTVKGKPPNNW